MADRDGSTENNENVANNENTEDNTVLYGDMYKNLAASYDVLMADAEYSDRTAFLERMLRQSPFPVGRVLDIGCGTGTVAWLLAERGYRVIAADLSEEMLSVARGKCAKFPGDFCPPLFVRQAMQKLDIGNRTVDAAISTIDALNYLTREEDLIETFRRVYHSLRSGGRFLFDVNTPYHFARMDEQLYMDEVGDVFCVWRTFFSEQTEICTYQVDLFRKRWDGAWDRHFEEHRERSWSAEQLRRFLLEAGFRRVTISGDMSTLPPEKEEDRWTVLAEKE